MRTRASFVVFSDDWGEHPSSCQHLFRRIAAQHDTLWVNTVGLRAPRPSWHDVRRAARKVAGWFSARAPATERAPSHPAHLRVLAPPMLPWMRPFPLRTVNRLSVHLALRRAVEHHPMPHAPVLVVTAPNGVDAIGVLGERALVYYCVDDFTRWPGVDGEVAASMEHELLERADLVIATSEQLVRTRSRAGRPALLLPHGVDVPHFARATDPSTVPHEGIRRGRPVLGFVGLVDERMDAALVRAIAQRRREWDLVFVGPTAQEFPMLRREPNVRLLPPVPYEMVPYVLAGFDVAMLPYARNELTAAINPLKLREYLASGLPIVSTPLPEVVRFAPHVRLADNAESFVLEAEDALDAPRDQRAARATLLAGESWDDRVETFLSLCDRVSRVSDPALARRELQEAGT